MYKIMDGLHPIRDLVPVFEATVGPAVKRFITGFEATVGLAAERFPIEYEATVGRFQRSGGPGGK